MARFLTKTQGSYAPNTDKQTTYIKKCKKAQDSVT